MHTVLVCIAFTFGPQKLFPKTESWIYAPHNKGVTFHWTGPLDWTTWLMYFWPQKSLKSGAKPQPRSWPRLLLGIRYHDCALVMSTEKLAYSYAVNLHGQWREVCQEWIRNGVLNYIQSRYPPSWVVITASLIAVVYHNIWSQNVWPVASRWFTLLQQLARCSSWATSVVTINSIRSALSCCDRDSNNCTKYHTSDVKFPKCGSG